MFTLIADLEFLISNQCASGLAEFAQPTCTGCMEDGTHPQTSFHGAKGREQEGMALSSSFPGADGMNIWSTKPSE